MIKLKGRQVVSKSNWPACYFMQEGIKRSSSIYWPHQKENEQCHSMICRDLDQGISIDQIWRKDYSCGKKIKGE